MAIFKALFLINQIFTVQLMVEPVLLTLDILTACFGFLFTGAVIIPLIYYTITQEDIYTKLND